MGRTLREQIQLDIEEWLDSYENGDRVGDIKRDSLELLDEIMVTIQEEVAKLVKV